MLERHGIKKGQELINLVEYLQIGHILAESFAADIRNKIRSSKSSHADKDSLIGLMNSSYFGPWLEEAARVSAFAWFLDSSDILGYVYRHDIQHQSSFWATPVVILGYVFNCDGAFAAHIGSKREDFQGRENVLAARHLPYLNGLYY